jgi:hypothetical protein
MNYQNLAYCRFLHIWMTLYLLNLSPYSPILSFYITFIFHLINLFNNKYISINKIYGLLLSDIFIIILLNLKSEKLHIFDNIIMFIFYNILLLIYNFIYNDNINIITLHTEKLKNDDIKYKHENYFQYIFRIWIHVFNTISIIINKINGFIPSIDEIY